MPDYGVTPGAFQNGKPRSKEADDMRRQFVEKGAIVAVVTVLVGLLSMPVSVAAEGLVLSQVETLGAIPVPDEECANVEGEGLLTGLASGLATSVTSGLTYLVECAVDAVTDRFFGDDGDDTSFQSRELYERMTTGFVGGFLGGLLVPAP